MNWNLLFTHACLLLISSQTAWAGSGNEWSYNGESGPSHWGEDFKDCDGKTQSPININPQGALYNPAMQRFDLTEYAKTARVHMNLVNKGGHTAEVDFTGEKIRIRGGSLPDNYVLSQFHFHWGSESRRGSEHTLDGTQFPMEMHLVHYQDHLTNISYASSHPSGLAVLGYFFKIGRKNENFDHLLKHFPKIIKTDEEVSIPAFPLLDLLPSPYVDFYRYDGSLTTPPCYESVIWSISTSFIEIAEEQLEVFRTLYDKDNHPIVDDFRPIQPLNQRTVTTTLNPRAEKDKEGAATLTTASLSVVALLVSSALIMRY